ncbi:MAG: hypothetical protein IKP88_09195, partial [Lachnospiraceae bacterium]|nr:hypothetical protein [Lachnospiraceae bacterium]
DKGATLENGKISMPQLFCQSLETKIAFKRSILSQIPNMDEKTEILFEQRFDRLFSVFVGEDIKSLAYFPIDSTWDEDRVNDVFERLNTGGVPLTGADLLFTKIKQNYEKYEEQLFDISKWIKEVTNGYIFTASEILQLINLIVKGTTRIDASKIKREDVDQFESVRNSIAEPLKDFFANFIYNSFNINNNSIISRKLAMLPLIVYSYKQFINGIPFNRLDAESIKRMKQYFIISQLNDWNTQGIIEGAVRKINESADFPFDAITTIAQSKNRLSTINASTIENNIWFSLKIMLPSRLYTLADSVRGRYKPELDHIFPKNLDNKPANYEVDTIWNLQPVQGKTNLLKSNTHPKLFFTDAQTAHFISEYDFVPQVNDSKWDNHKEFIEWRKAKMIEFINSEYGIVIL